MPRDKAAMIVEAFDTEDESIFLILGDWMEDQGDPETQRFRNGDWHDQDYSHATISLYWKQIQQFEKCPSVKVFIRLLRANWGHQKFLKWYSPLFSEGQKNIYQMMLDPKLFKALFGEAVRYSVKYRYPRCTEEELRSLCDHAKEVCYLFKAKEDLEAWCELWKNRRFYLQRKLANWQKYPNHINPILGKL